MAKPNDAPAGGNARPAIETALDQIESVRALHRDAIRTLNGLADTLRQVQRDQRASTREVQSVRSTLEKLQSVRL